jgi:hypothetical protein
VAHAFVPRQISVTPCFALEGTASFASQKGASLDYTYKTPAAISRPLILKTELAAPQKLGVHSTHVLAFVRKKS